MMSSGRQRFSSRIGRLSGAPLCSPSLLSLLLGAASGVAAGAGCGCRVVLFLFVVVAVVWFLLSLLTSCSCGPLGGRGGVVCLCQRWGGIKQIQRYGWYDDATAGGRGEDTLPLPLLLPHSLNVTCDSGEHPPTTPASCLCSLLMPPRPTTRLRPPSHCSHRLCPSYLLDGTWPRLGPIGHRRSVCTTPDAPSVRVLSSPPNCPSHLAQPSETNIRGAVPSYPFCTNCSALFCCSSVQQTPLHCTYPSHALRLLDVYSKVQCH